MPITTDEGPTDLIPPSVINNSNNAERGFVDAHVSPQTDDEWTEDAQVLDKRMKGMT